METKRSIGVTIWAWLFILGSVLGIVGLVLKSTGGGMCPLGGKAATMPASQVPVAWVLNVVGLFCGIFLLQLRDWARRLIIALALISIVYSVVASIQAYPQMKKDFSEKLAAQQQKIKEQYKPEYQNRELEKLKDMGSVSKYGALSILIFVNLLVVVWNSAVIFFFTRPKVKEQFLARG